MPLRLKDISSWMERPLGGLAYGLIGVVAFGIKFNIDRFFAIVVFEHPWYLWDYWKGANAFYLWDLRKQDMFFYGSMLALAVPFIALGVVMTWRRLKTLNLSPWFVCLFFIPFLNLPFFAALALMRTPVVTSQKSFDDVKEGIGRFIPETGKSSAVVAVLVTAVFVTALTGLNAAVFRRYAWGLFVFLPFVHGVLASWMFGFHRQRSLSDSLTVVFTSCLMAGGLLMIFAIEGAICILMAAPIWIALAFIGGWVGWSIQGARWKQIQQTFVFYLLVSGMPFLMGAEFALRPVAPLLEARTSMDIQAPPSVVWKHVVAFSDLPPPTEWIFKTGLSYPIRARIHGSGVGAVRHCEFSTGIFVEPIQVWKEPSLLRFSVENTPSPMEEMSLYSHIEPPHMKGYMVSRQGQFLLVPLAGGGTQLQGTTWYQHNLWPARYWELWSDFIIHRIHRRVLKHIRTLSEEDYQRGIRHG